MGDDGKKPDRPIFCGNFEYDAREKDIVRLFDKYGDVERCDMKTGFAFLYMRDERDGNQAIRKLDGQEFGQKRRRLKVEWAKMPGAIVQDKETTRRQTAKPTTTLFIVNFDVHRVRERDVERHFEEFGRLKRVEIKRNYAFVQYDNVESATRALEKTNGRDLMGRAITVEYTMNSDPHSRPLPSQRGRSRSRSRSPTRRRRSPSLDVRRRSPSPRRRRSPSPPPRRRSPSPIPRKRSPSPAARRRSPSPAARRAVSPVGGGARAASLSVSRSPSYERHVPLAVRRVSRSPVRGDVESPRRARSYSHSRSRSR